MELFKITCVTCRAGLSVRNESLIGQIVACPKCGSMVQITPPEPEVPPAEAGPPVAEGAAGTSYALVAWSMGGLAVAATVFGAILLWPSAPATSDAAPPRTSEKQVIDETARPPVAAMREPAAEETTHVTPTPAAPQEPVAVEEEIIAEAPIEVANAHAEAPPMEEPRAARQFDALDLDPEGLDLATLDQEPVRSFDDRSSAEPPPSPEPETSTQPVVRRGVDREHNLADRDAHERFERRLPALSVKKMPLVDFLALTSQLSGTPVSVGSEHLQMAGISPRKSVSVDIRDRSLKAILAEALDPLRLEHDFRGAQVVLTRQGADHVREIDYPVDDLKSEPKQLAAWVQQLVAPESWQTGKLKVAGDVLQIKQSQRVHYQVLVFLERLRLVSGLPTRSKYPVQRLAPTPLHAAMAERLSAPALFTFSQETPLADVLLHWQREIDVPLLVDWPALAEVELWPESTIVCAVADKTWEEALSEVLEPLGLDWRATFGGAIEISVTEKLANDPQLELYPLADGNATDFQQLTSRLEEQLSPVEGELVYDATANALFARYPASAQRRILAWLAEQELLRTR